MYLITKFGVTKDGFNRKTYVDIIKDMQGLARQLFGEDIDLSERNPLGKILQNTAWEISILWELAEDVYNSAFVDTSEDISLDGVGKYVAASRKSAQPSKGTITVKGDKDTRVPKGFRVSTEKSGIVFETTENKVIGELGNVDIPIISINTGVDNNVPSNSITKIVNPIQGVSEVSNLHPTKDGLDVEQDKDFRERYYRSVSLGGSSTRESVEAALLDIPNVTDAFVEENETMEFIDDIPPKSLAPYVFGSTDEEIARVILLSKAGGIRSYGATEVKVEDSKGILHTIGFTRPIVKDIYIKVNIERGIGYPGDSVIIRSILDYVGGQDVDGVEYKGLKLGENVVISKLTSKVGCLEGIKDVNVEISSDNVSFISANIEIAKKEIARTSFDKVVINHV